MAIPSGSGTEVLKRATYDGNLNTAPVIINGVANHIYTILTITMCEASSSSETISIYIEPSGSGQVILYRNIALPTAGTFVVNDKFVMTGTDHLVLYSSDTSNIDCLVSYIDQDWT